MIPCLEPVLTTRPGAPCSIMRGTNARTPWTTPQKLTPSAACQSSSRPNAPPPTPGRGVVHQQPDLAERRVDGFLQRLDLFRACHVGRHGKDILIAARGKPGDLIARRLQLLGQDVGHADAHAERGEALARGEPDAHRGAGDHGDASGRQHAMAHCAIS